MMVKTLLGFVLVMAFAQAETKLPADFPTLLKISKEELELKTDAHRQAWGIDKIIRWDFNQDSGDLIFALPDRLKATAPGQIIGSYNTEDHTWLWAWANQSIDDKLKVDALQVRKYGEEHHLKQLIERKWVGTEADAWAMTALAVKLCGKQGGYLGPSGATKVFFSFGEVVLATK